MYKDVQRVLHGSRNHKIGIYLADHRVQPVPHPHLVTKPRALSAMSWCSLDTSRDKDSQPPWAVPCNA